MRRLLAPLLLMFCAENVAATHEGWKLLRRSDPPFRFEYPSTWVEKTPRGENVKALVSSNDATTGANCSVGMRADRALEGVGSAEAIAEFGGPEGVGSMLSEGQPGSKVLWSRMSALDGRPAVLTLMSVQYATVKGSADIRQLSLWSMVDGRIVYFVCGSDPGHFSETEPTFVDIFSTFVFESWKN